ncbi:hypothetical protein [Aliarcobacter butzleri]|uniref:hypothetical protein n=1 Tax=Aliarcobacter butzleri TaxID=28197 RepID=UPI00263E166B|nr:hypothetical protein [Aliarcobacter butzleri]MDN5053888.1 hypothetical protein [Aliarcobacter butzleri]
MIKTIFITITMIFFIGCFNQDPIKIVRDGTMSIDESLTIGQAFDNWEECENNKWNSIVEKNGRNIVEFNCDLKNIKSEIKTLFDNNTITKNEFSLLDLKNAQFKVRWAINTDKKSFKIDDIKITYLWMDDLEKTYDINPLFLESIYKNKPFGGHKGIYMLTFKDLVDEYYKENKIVIDLELLIGVADNSFSLMKSKNLFNDSKFYSEVNNSNNVNELYFSLKKVNNNLKSSDNIMDFIFSDLVNLSFNDKMKLEKIDSSFLATSIAIKLLKLYEEDKEIPLNDKFLTSYSLDFALDFEPFVSMNKTKFNIFMYILNKPRLSVKLIAEPNNERNLFFQLFMEDEFSSNDFVILIINEVLNKNIKLTFNELTEINKLKISHPSLFYKLNTIKEDYIKDKRNYELSIYIHLPTEKYNGLTIKFIGNAENYFNAFEKKSDIKIEENANKWNKKNYENILNNNISKEMKQEFLNLFGVKEGDISINYKLK